MGSRCFLTKEIQKTIPKKKTLQKIETAHLRENIALGLTHSMLVLCWARPDALVLKWVQWWQFYPFQLSMNIIGAVCQYVCHHCSSHGGWWDLYIIGAISLSVIVCLFVTNQPCDYKYNESSDDDVFATCKCNGCISAVDTEPSSVIVTRPSSADEEPDGPRHSKNTYGMELLLCGNM